MLAGRLILNLTMTPFERTHHSVYTRETVIYIAHNGLHEKSDPPPVLIVKDVENVLNTVTKEQQPLVDPVVINPFVSSKVRMHKPKGEEQLDLQSQARSKCVRK